MRTRLNNCRSSKVNTGNARTALSTGNRSKLSGPISSIPSQSDFRILEDGDFRILENGDFRILE